MNNCSLLQLAKQLKNFQTVGVVCHVRPDGDALGSGLALCLALKNAGKRAYMLCEDEVPERLKILPSIAGVCTSWPLPKEQFNALIAVDCADLSRMGGFAKGYEKFKGVTVNIDHHISNTGFGALNYVYDCTATCQLIPEILQACGWEITADIANLLALGLLTDSGNFAHKDVSEKTFSVAAQLRAAGADFSYLVYENFSKQTKARAVLYGRVMNRLRFGLEDKLAVVTVTLQDFEATGTDKSATEGFVDFPLSIEGVEVALAIMEVKRKQYKISLRSKGTVNVNQVAATFGGGGHVLASGCMLCGEYEEVVERLTYAVSQHL